MAQEVKSIRADEATLTRLREIAKDFPSQGDALAALVQAYETDRSRTALPGRAAEIDSFDASVKRLRELYLGSLSLYQEAEAQAREAVALELKSRDTTIRNLQRQLEEAGAAQKAAQDELARLRPEAEALRVALEAKGSEIEALQQTIAAKDMAIEAMKSQVDSSKPKTGTK